MDELLTAKDLDRAVDVAARKSGAVVAQYAASLSQNNDSAEIGSSVELAVEFLVPPESVGRFSAAFEDALLKSHDYAKARHAGEFRGPLVRLIPAGAFHQWRVAWRKSICWQRERRWSGARDLIEGVIRQSLMGWREIALS